MHPRSLPLLLLALLSTSAAGPVESRAKLCAELRDSEVVLAEQEVRLLDQLESPTALAAEKEGEKDRLTQVRELLSTIDHALEAGCLVRSPDLGLASSR